MKLPVILIGKGPSAIKIPKSDRYLIAAINHAVEFSEEIDFFFMNDLQVAKEISFKGIKKIIIPTFPHIHEQASNISCFELLKMTDEKGETYIPQNIDIDIYQLHTTPVPVGGVTYFGPIHSTGETAVSWLINNGYKEIITTGIDTVDGHHQTFEEKGQTGNERDASWFQKNYFRMLRRVREAEGEIKRIEDSVFKTIS